MPQREFFKFLLKGLLLAFLFCAESMASWIPFRILGMQYPQVARAARVEGVVEAKCTLLPDGSVAGVEILSGHPLLIPAVKANLLRWTFRDDKIDDRSSNVAVMQYTFQLKGNCDKNNKCKEEFWCELPNRVTIVSEMPNLNTGKGPNGKK